MVEPNSYPALIDSNSALSREEELTLLCSQAKVSEKRKDEISSIIASRGVDWDRVLEVSSFHQVCPLVYRQLSGIDSIPEDVTSRLRESTARTFAANQTFLKEARSFQEILKERGEECIFTKGLSFIMDIYQDAGLRNFSDIDVLVKDIKKVDKILSASGFKEHGEGDDNGYRAQRVYSKDGRVFFDVHSDFIGRSLHSKMMNIDKGAIFRNKRCLSYQGIEIYTMDLVHTLIYQCLHVSMQHSFMGIRWYVDINEFLNKYSGELDWKELLELTRKYRIKRPVYYALYFSKEMLEAPVPAGVLEELKTSRRKIDKWFFSKIKSKPDGVDYLAELILFDSWWEMTRFTVVSFIKHPSLSGHFFKIIGRAFKQVFSKE